MSRGRIILFLEMKTVQISLKHVSTVRTLCGLTKIVASLRLNQMRALIINTSAKAVNTVFQTYSLEPYFDVVITRECVKRLKPDPEGILLAVKQLGGNKFFMVGDLARARCLDGIQHQERHGKRFNLDNSRPY
jgi:beta-phosphoglucomutase-like phosphatase (HAD superfamily)